MIPALLPDEVKVAHKTGWITGVRHDAGIAFVPDGPSYSIAFLSRNLADVDAGVKVITETSRRVLNAMTTEA